MDNLKKDELLYVAAVMFKWQKDGKTYDYFIPADLKVSVGDKVVVETSRGEATVEVMAIKSDSDLAQKKILRLIEPERLPGEEGGDGDYVNDSDMGARG
jgi:primosomal protein N'